MRLIDADRLINLLEPTRKCFVTDGEGIIRLLSDTPTVDLRTAANLQGYKLVTKGESRRQATYKKCKDCKYHTGEISSIGRACENPKKDFKTWTAQFKYGHTKACKEFVEKGSESE